MQRLARSDLSVEPRPVTPAAVPSACCPLVPPAQEAIWPGRLVAAESAMPLAPPPRSSPAAALPALPPLRPRQILRRTPSPPAACGHGLFLGSFDTAKARDRLHACNITHILNVSTHLPNLFPAHFTYANIQVEDSPRSRLLPYFAPAARFVDAARSRGGAVLIHCRAGISRSATLAMACLMLREGKTLAAAFAAVQRCRPLVSPNVQFWVDLRQCEAELQGAPGSSMRLAAFDPGSIPVAAGLDAAMRLWLDGELGAIGERAPCASHDALVRAACRESPAEPLQVALANAVFACLRLYPGEQTRHRRARTLLARLLGALVGEARLQPPLLQQALTSLRQGAAWAAFAAATPQADAMLRRLAAAV